MPHKVPFKVIHASGQDDVCRASELNYHSPVTRGWMAARYCLYPQDIVIQLERSTRIKKIQVLSHQHSIATRIEFFVGDVPDGMPVILDNARYTRLGYVLLSDNEKTAYKARELKYVSLSDNEKTAYKARELKSVQVDAVGIFLKLNIHKNHINKYNLYNQVGLVAVNVIGDRVKKALDDLDDMDIFGEHKKKLESDPTLEGLYNRPDYISPLDDLAFDMYQDPEIAQIIRRLEHKKQEAVLQERYEYAKKLKHAIAELQKVGEKLGKYEVEKRQAVENEDYDKAKLKKVQMDEYRLQVYRDLGVNDLLETSGSRHPQKVHLEPRHPTPPSRLLDLPRTPPSPPPKTPYDERPLPAIKSHRTQSPGSPPPRTPYDERRLPIHNKELAPLDNAPPSPKPAYDERPLPGAAKVKASVIEDEEAPPPDSGGITGEAEQMTEKDLREASAAIDIFGEPLVAKAYSKTWSYREDALLAVYKQMQELPTSTSKDDAKSTMRASIFLVKRAIEDKVYAVFKAGLMLLKMILTEYVPKHKIPKSDTINCVERTLPNLFHKSGDTAVRNRDDAKNFIYEMSRFPEVKPTMVVPHECVKPWKANVAMAPRLAQSRTEIVEALYEQLGLKDKSGLTTDNIMNYCVVALQHTSADVRQVAERIVKALYKEVGSPVKDYLPPDDEKTRKNTMWRLLFEYFDKVDGKPSRADKQRKRAEDEERKQQEIDGLQKQLQQLKDMASGKAPIDEKVVSQRTPKTQSKNKPKPRAQPKQDQDDDASYNMDKTENDITSICIFCGERNASFTEEGLDLHYWKNCPMLKRCANCKQVVEIATYTDHLLTECEAKANYAKCNRCVEAIPKGEHEGHVAEKSCNASKPGLNHCPLCHQNISSGEDGWKNHLMGKDGCKQNPRRLLALNKQPQTGKTGGSILRGKAKPNLKKTTPR